MNAKFNDILGDIVHLASGAILADDEAIKRQAMADIIDALTFVVPVVGRDVLGAPDPTSVGRDVLGAPQGLSKFLTVKEGVTLVRFKGDGIVRLVARRAGKQGNPNTIFEIAVDHEKDHAVVMRDERELFSISGLTVGHNIVEKLAISALHRYLKDQRPSKSKRRRSAKLRGDHPSTINP